MTMARSANGLSITSSNGAERQELMNTIRASDDACLGVPPDYPSKVREARRNLLTTTASNLQLLTSFEQIEAVQKEWERLQWYPETDPDFARLVVESRVESTGLCVIALSEAGSVRAIIVGRTDRARFQSFANFTTALQPKLRILRVLYGGVLGDWRQEDVDKLLIALREGLSRGAWDIVQFRMLNRQSEIWTRSKHHFIRICRGSVGPPNLHWALRIPKTYTEFLSGLDKIVRKNLKRHIKLLEADFSDVSVKRFDRAADLEIIATVTESIISKTYQEGLGKSWTSDEMRKRLALWLGKGCFRAFFLFVNGQPCAFQHVLKYRSRAFGQGTGYDPAFRRYGVGRYIQLKVLEDLCNSQDVIEFDFGHGDAQYKRELCRDYTEEADLVLFRISPGALLANAIRTGEIRLRQLSKLALKFIGMFAFVKAAWRESRRNETL
jgi:hypothetical protein